MRDLGFGEDLEVWNSKETSRRLGTGAYYGAVRFPKVRVMSDKVFKIMISVDRQCG